MRLLAKNSIRLSMATAIVLATGPVLGAPASGNLYDVDFEPPTHTAGSLPAPSANLPTPRLGPTNVVFGDPTVVEDHAGFSSQSLLFTGNHVANNTGPS
jgi:hypothetical protein